MSPKSPTKVSPEQTLESRDNGELIAQPKKDMIVEFNGGSEKAKIRTRDGGLNGEDKDLCQKGMLAILDTVVKDLTVGTDMHVFLSFLC